MNKRILILAIIAIAASFLIVGSSSMDLDSESSDSDDVIIIDIPIIPEVSTVTFDTHGGSLIDDATTRPGMTVPEPVDPVKSDFVFKGWYIEESLIHEYDFSWPVTSDMTLHAAWVPEYITVTFDTAGGSHIDPITAAYGSPLTAPADPVRTGYVFTGWSPELPETMPSADTTYHAQWTLDLHVLISTKEEAHLLGDELDAMGDKSLKVVYRDGLSVTIPNEVIKISCGYISVRAEPTTGYTDAQIQAIGDNPAYNITVTIGEVHVGSYDSPALITLPYTASPDDDPSKISVVHVGTDGSKETIPCTYDWERRIVTFHTEHCSVFMIENSNPVPEPPESPVKWYLFILPVITLVVVAVIYLRR